MNSYCNKILDIIESAEKSLSRDEFSKFSDYCIILLERKTNDNYVPLIPLCEFLGRLIHFDNDFGGEDYELHPALNWYSTITYWMKNVIRNIPDLSEENNRNE